jgi:hypothetical protein
LFKASANGGCDLGLASLRHMSQDIAREMHPAAMVLE